MGRLIDKAQSNLRNIQRYYIKADNETIDFAIDILRKYQKIEDIITCPLDIQEDVFRYKAICEVVGKKNITHGTYEGESR